MKIPFWCVHEPDNSQHIRRVEHVEKKADRQLNRAHEIAHEADKAVAVLQNTTLRNHFGENLETAYVRRTKKKLPWSR